MTSHEKCFFELPERRRGALPEFGFEWMFGMNIWIYGSLNH